MARYEGPRDFSTNNPELLQRELRKLADELDKVMQAQQEGGPRRWLFADPVRSSAALKVGYITPVSTSGMSPTPDIPLILPPWDASLVGKECGVERRQTSGIVTVRAASGGLLNDSTSALTLPTQLRIYLFVATPLGWKAVDDA